MKLDLDKILKVDDGIVYFQEEPSIYKSLKYEDHYQIFNGDMYDDFDGNFYLSNLFTIASGKDIKRIIYNYVDFLTELKKTVGSFNRISILSGEHQRVIGTTWPSYVLCSSKEDVEKIFEEDGSFMQLCEDKIFHLLSGTWYDHYDHLDKEQYHVKVRAHWGYHDETHGTIERISISELFETEKDPIKIEDSSSEGKKRKGVFHRLMDRLFH